tara:strand:+ start:4571 stop:5584 length:1014 start_codon:yes stop_codon:yes gene_type:complete
MKKNSKTLIIAEAGVNHNGKISIAKKLIDIASKAGADIVKFQTFRVDLGVSKSAKKANYQIKSTSGSANQYEMLKKLELDYKDHVQLIKHCKKRHIEFLSSPFDLESLKLLVRLKLKKIKIPSGEITNVLLLKEIGKLNKQVILSTGMAKIREIEKAINILTKFGTKKNKIAILHCTTEYPTPMNEVNLKAILSMKKKFKTKVGLSDHTLGSEVAIAAIAAGAEIIEKHLTIDKKMSGPDHKASLEPKELFYLVKSIRNIEKALGDGIKRPTKSEKKYISIVRKYIVASQKIKKGEKFSNNNVTLKRCRKGLEPHLISKVLGKISKRNFEMDEIIKL